jgi:sugar lactone lactonase YvrE
MTNPGGLAFDPAGNLYICDVANNRVRKVGTDGIITTIAGNGTTTYGGEGVVATATGMSQPNYVCISPTGEVIISVTTHQRIRSVNAAGLMTTIAGTGTAGYTGDNVAATTSRMNIHQAVLPLTAPGTCI